MHPEDQKQLIRQAALGFAQKHNYEIDTSHHSAIIFTNIEDAFCISVFEQIRKRPEWFKRTQKKHSKAKTRGVLEMQSSNSSDALLMNIFCHPEIAHWKGVADVLGFSPANPVFGYKARIKKANEREEETEIDMVIGDSFVEAKLTETDFCQKNATTIEKYIDLRTHFHIDCLALQNGDYQNYQVIRNILAAIQHQKRHILLCDERRPDLARRYLETVLCLKEHAHRMSCRVVFWQELQRACGQELGSFLESKYSIC